MFDRARVCTLCFRIYKELENYYFKELRKNLPGANEDGAGLSEEETERLMNREVKNDKDDADPRARVDKALGGLFIQVKKNMDKFAEISRTTGSYKAKDAMLKTLDPKSNQTQGFSDTIKASAPQNITKLPPIQRKQTEKNGSGSGAAQKMTRNASAAKSNAFGAKSIDLLKSL